MYNIKFNAKKYIGGLVNLLALKLAFLLMRLDHSNPM